MAVTCPAGHTSTSTDYCDTCGAAIEAARGVPPASEAGVPPPGEGGVPPAGEAAPAASGGGPAAATTPCPNCGAPATVDDAFCEVCGLDFATGEMPTKPQPAVEVGADPETGAAPSAASAPPAAAVEGWVAVVEADRAFYEGNESPDVELPFPEGQAARVVPLKTGEVLIGRRSDSRGIFPDLDLGAPAEDPGVSRRHAILRHRDDGSWVVIDQGSTNGTRVSGVKAPVQPGEERLLLNGDQLLLGAWTRITLKRE